MYENISDNYTWKYGLLHFPTILHSFLIILLFSILFPWCRSCLAPESWLFPWAFKSPELGSVKTSLRPHPRVDHCSFLQENGWTWEGKPTAFETSRVENVLLIPSVKANQVSLQLSPADEALETAAVVRLPCWVSNVSIHDAGCWCAGPWGRAQ